MRLTVLIVDDDQNYRFAMRQMILWEKYDFHIKEEAVNGKHALEILEKTKIDLIITDMSMPVMNGVELIKKVKEIYPDIKVIALSAYDDFEFVKESLKCGAQDYILKYEIEEESVLKVILEVKEKILKDKKVKDVENFIQQEKLSFVEDILRDALMGKNHNEIQLKSCFELLGISLIKSKLIVVLIESVHEIDSSKIIDIINLSNKNKHSCYINTGLTAIICDYSFCISSLQIHEELNLFLLKLKNKIGEFQEITIGVSQICYETNQLFKAFDQAKKAMDERLYGGKNQIYTYKAEVHTKTESLYINYEGIEKAAKATDIDTLRLIIDQFIIDIKRIKPALNNINKGMADMYMAVYTVAFEQKLINRLTSGDLQSIINKIEMSKTLEEKVSFLLDSLECVYNRFNQSNQSIGYDIKKAMAFIQDHYMEDITLSSLGAHIGLSENYLCNLFKQETGDTMIKYINSIRIDKAKELICKSNMKVYKIAERVGFNNTTYFSTTFKKVTGMTITEFKHKSKFHNNFN